MLRFARENLRWGYQRIVGKLKGVGINISATTVRTWLRQEGLAPLALAEGQPGASLFVHTGRQRANFVFTVAIVSVVWFTSTSWRRDQVFAPYTLRRRWPRHPAQRFARSRRTY